VSNDGNDQTNFLSVDLSLVSMKPWPRSVFVNRTDGFKVSRKTKPYAFI